MKFLIPFLIFSSCVNHSKKNEMLGEWCFSNKSSDFKVSLQRKSDTIFLNYIYILDNGTRINESTGNSVGYIISSNIEDTGFTISVEDAYAKAITFDSSISIRYNIRLAYNKSDSTLTWEDVSEQKSNFLPQKVILEKCL